MLTQDNASRNGSKPTRNADYRHAQAVGRQRKANAAPTPQHKAQCIQRCVQKAVTEGTPVDLTPHGQIDDATWCELLSIVSNEELAAINAASGQSTPDDDADADEPIPYDVTQDNESAPAPAPAMPGWRDEHPKYVHSMEWHDSLGIKHMLVFRDDDLDEVLRQARMIREFVKALHN